MTPQTIVADRQELETALENAIDDKAMAGLKKKAQSLLDDVVNDIEWGLKGQLASNLAYHASDMAERAVQALLAGNEDEMRRSLSCVDGGYTGRHGGPYNNRTMAEQHPIIHGALHESGAIALRKKIAQAHADLIRNERIKDLEDQVASLVAQNRQLQARLEQANERLRELA